MSELIITPRLRLEPLEPAHAAALFEGLQHPAIYDFLDEQPPAEIAALTERYRRLSTRRSPDGRDLWLNRALWSFADAAYVGYVQATVPPTDPTEIAYVLIPTWWRQGFAREAVTAMLTELRTRHHTDAFVAQVDPANQRSIALLLHLGFDFAGTTADGRDHIYRLAP